MKMAPFDRFYTTLYCSAIVSIALYAVPFSSYLTFSNRDLNLDYRSLVTVESLGAVFYSPSVWPYLQPFMRHSASKNSVTLKTGLRVVQGH